MRMLQRVTLGVTGVMRAMSGGRFGGSCVPLMQIRFVVVAARAVFLGTVIGGAVNAMFIKSMPRMHERCVLQQQDSSSKDRDETM